MKKFILSFVLCICGLFLFACSSGTTSGVSGSETKDNVSFVKSFYEEYLTAVDKYEDTSAILQKYMTPLLIEELDLRSKENSNDSITESQDSTGFIDKMTVKEYQEKDTVLVMFDGNNGEGGLDSINIIMHIINDNGTKKINALDSTIIRTSENGTPEVIDHKTKYANKETLTDADKKEMESMKKYYEDLEEEGYIG